MEADKIKEATNKITGEQTAMEAAREVIRPWEGFEVGDEMDGAEEQAGIQPEPARREYGFPNAGERNGVVELFPVEEAGMVPEMPRWVVYGGLGAVVVAQAVISDPASGFEQDDDRAVYLFVIFLASLFGLLLVMIRVGWA